MIKGKQKVEEERMEKTERALAYLGAEVFLVC